MNLSLGPVLVVGVGLAISGPAAAGGIRGTVRVPAMATPPMEHHNAYPGQANSMVMVEPVAHGLPGDAVVSVEKIPAEAESVLARTDRVPQLAQKNQSFVPRVLPIAVGTTVEFPNMDPIFHNVFSVSPVRRFDLGKYPRGHSRSVVFQKIGIVQVYCDIHADMAAFILVLPNHAFTQPGPNGVYAITGLPPGRYRLRVWHPDLPATSRLVEVPESGEAQADFDLGTPGAPAGPENSDEVVPVKH
jgi:plastocyanin